MSLSVEGIEAGVTRLRMRSWRGALVGYDVSAYFVGDVLIDTGFPRAARAFDAAVRTIRPRGVVVTHWHEDHAGNVPALAALGLPAAMHAECEEQLRERPPIRLYRREVWGQTAPLTAALEQFDPSPLATI